MGDSSANYILLRKSLDMSDQMCVKCKQFFGNPDKLHMCSVCYK